MLSSHVNNIFEVMFVSSLIFSPSLVFSSKLQSHLSKESNCSDCESDDCEIAYGYDSENPLRNLCLIEFHGIDNWGWTVLNWNVNNDFDFESESDNENEIRTLDLYAGASNCDLNNGMIVGDVTLSYNFNKNLLTMAFTVDSPFYFRQVNAYVGFDILARDKDGTHTTNPSEFPQRYNNEAGFNTYRFDFNIDNPNANFNIIAHATVKKY